MPPLLSNDTQTRQQLGSSFTNDVNILSGSFKTKHDNYSKLQTIKMNIKGDKNMDGIMKELATRAKST